MLNQQWANKSLHHYYFVISHGWSSNVAPTTEEKFSPTLKFKQVWLDDWEDSAIFFKTGDDIWHNQETKSGY